MVKEWIIFKSLSIRCSPSITHRALRDYKSLGFARFLAFSLLVAKLGLLNICFAFPPPYRRDLWVLWTENCFLLCLAWPLHHCLEHPCTCWGLLLGEQTHHHLGDLVQKKTLQFFFHGRAEFLEDIGFVLFSLFNVIWATFYLEVSFLQFIFYISVHTIIQKLNLNGSREAFIEDQF